MTSTGRSRPTLSDRCCRVWSTPLSTRRGAGTYHVLRRRRLWRRLCRRHARPLLHRRHPEEILEAGRRAVPEGSLFRETIEDVHACYDKGLTWQEAWQYIEDKWGIPITVSTARISPSTSTPSSTPLMCSLGLLYGGGDFEQSMKIAMMCGQDSDCNPSTVGGILGNWMGYEAIPDKWKRELKRTDSCLLIPTAISIRW